MKKFIAYFDYLGFKQFIENNNLDYQKKIIGNNFRDMENALGQGKLKESRPGVVIADLKDSKINCINFSDTVVFWTNDDSEESLKEILDVAYRFHWQTIGYFFPVRGSLVYGEIEYVGFKQINNVGGNYNINSVFGKGLIEVHEKAEKQHWAGTVIAENFIEELLVRGYVPENFLKAYAKKFKVPYKNGMEKPEEFVLNLNKGGLNDRAFKNCCDAIKENFASHKKSVDSDDVQVKIENTLNFLASFREQKESAST